mgnify:CR=1 FL=1
MGDRPQSPPPDDDDEVLGGVEHLTARLVLRHLRERAGMLTQELRHAHAQAIDAGAVEASVHRGAPREPVTGGRSLVEARQLRRGREWPTSLRRRGARPLGPCAGAGRGRGRRRLV